MNEEPTVEEVFDLSELDPDLLDDPDNWRPPNEVNLFKVNLEKEFQTYSALWYDTENEMIHTSLNFHEPGQKYRIVDFDEDHAFIQSLKSPELDTSEILTYLTDGDQTFLFDGDEYRPTLIGHADRVFDDIAELYSLAERKYNSRSTDDPSYGIPPAE